MCVFSDVYVFGIGEQVKKDQLNVLASQKRGEKHVFILKDFETLGEVFNSIISKYRVCVASARVSLLFRWFSLTQPTSKTFKTFFR